jgi:uncharacterized membrane protein
VITAAPLAVTWLILDFLFDQLSRIGRPWVGAIARAIAPEQPFLASLLQNETFLSILAVVTILAALWALGWMTTQVVGQRLALQLLFLFEMSTACFGLVGAAPERPCDDACGLDTPLCEL